MELHFDLSTYKCGVTYIDCSNHVLIDLGVFAVVSTVRVSMRVINTILKQPCMVHFYSYTSNLYVIWDLYSDIVILLYYTIICVFILTYWFLPNASMFVCNDLSLFDVHNTSIFICNEFAYNISQSWMQFEDVCRICIFLYNIFKMQIFQRTCPYSYFFERYRTLYVLLILYCNYIINQTHKIYDILNCYLLRM